MIAVMIAVGTGEDDDAEFHVYILARQANSSGFGN
jgi:hypothetical protein